MATAADRLEIVRNRLRITTTKFDDEIESLIAACETDLATAGADLKDDNLSTEAVVLYCKAYFGFFEDSDKYLDRYNALKTQMAHSTEYAEATAE